MTNSYQSALGKYIAQGNFLELKKSFQKFDNMNLLISISMFSTCILLINPFVSIYTKGISDANYYQPIFAIIILLANMFYCMREPYRFLILAAGKFKETNFGAIMEAVLNLVLSLVLIKKFGLTGVAVGTFIAIVYRFGYFIVYLKKNILLKSYKEYIQPIIKTVIIVVINIYVYTVVKININNFVSFCIYGSIAFSIEIIVAYIFYIKVNFSGKKKNE